VHLSIWNASIDSIMQRLEPALRRTAEEISVPMGYRAG
jgi:hypothetical protein